MSSLKNNYKPGPLIERQMRLRDLKEPVSSRITAAKSPGRYRFITISRSLGSLGEEVAASVARRLDWHVYDREIVEQIVRDKHAHRHLVEQLDERSQNLVEDAVARLLGMVEGRGLGREEYHESLLRTVVVLGSHGSAILVGRGANFILWDQPGLHVRIVASPEVRVDRLSEIWSTTAEEARRRMEESDAERDRFIRRLFKRDTNDPLAYDLVFDTDRLSIEQITDSILAAIGVHA